MTYCYIDICITKYNKNIIQPYYDDANDTLGIIKIVMKFPVFTVISNCSNILLRTSFFYLDLKLTYKNILLKDMVTFLKKASFTEVLSTIILFFSIVTILRYLLIITSITLKEFSYLVTVHDSKKVIAKVLFTVFLLCLKRKRKQPKLDRNNFLSL